jgi:hypothetical protein
MTLNECRLLQADAAALAAEAWATLRTTCLRDSTVQERAVALSAVEGAERERQILARLEVELIESGRVPGKTPREALPRPLAAVTPERAPDAAKGPATPRDAAL